HRLDGELVARERRQRFDEDEDVRVAGGGLVGRRFGDGLEGWHGGDASDGVERSHLSAGRPSGETRLGATGSRAPYTPSATRSPDHERTRTTGTPHQEPLCGRPRQVPRVVRRVRLGRVGRADRSGREVGKARPSDLRSRGRSESEQGPRPLRHRTSAAFWVRYRELPAEVRKVADKNFRLLKRDPRHPSLRFKRIEKLWSARV